MPSVPWEVQSWLSNREESRAVLYALAVIGISHSCPKQHLLRY
jgi:hypothetical protein